MGRIARRGPAESRRDVAKDRPVAVAGIPDMVDRAARRLDQEGRPQRHAPVADPARRPMLRGRKRHIYRGRERDPLAPVVGLGTQGRVVTAQDRVVAERHDDAAGMDPRQRRQGREIHVVVMVVRDEDRVERRQCFHRDAGRAHALRPGEGERAGAPRPDRVDEQVEPGRLDEVARVADRGDPERRPGEAFDRRRGRRVVDAGRPGGEAGYR